MAVPGEGEDVYLTLLLNDTYLPGALVLAHSLRDGGTTKKLGALVTLDTVAVEVVTQLQAVYDYVIPVPRIQNPNPSNLSLMNRTDLHSAFTKINLWKQTQFRKIVYVDADVVAYRAVDELFDIDHPFSAAPDIGWPDLFNSGVMVLTPNMGDYYALVAMAERGISFDGADQGLLNMHFKNSYNRIPFTYNVTPSAHYQYVPAYRHFQSSINMIHFIGSNKPWFQGRHASTGSPAFDEMTGRWWAVYDRHYRDESSNAPGKPSIALVQYLTRGEFLPTALRGNDRNVETEQHHGQPHDPQQAPHDAQHRDPQRVAPQPGEPRGEQYSQHSMPPAVPTDNNNFEEDYDAEARKEQVRQGLAGPQQHTISYSNWDAQRQPPPADTKPEAANLPTASYEMSTDTAPYVAPERYPSPPKNIGYAIPTHHEQPKPIFPWEANREAPTRVFAEDAPRSRASTTTSAPSTEPPAPERNEPKTPTTPSLSAASSDPWGSFTRTNAWDEVPEIERYVDSMQKHRRASLKGPGAMTMPAADEAADVTEWKRRGSRLTDFPSETERPSLPVTPAPIRRPKFWGGGGPGVDDEDDDDGQLPAAAGVPPQSDWDPMVQLQKLAKQQSDALLERLGGGKRDSSDMPPRPVPFGSEELVSPTYVQQSAIVSPVPVKGNAGSRSIRNIIADQETPQPAATGGATQAAPIAEPSYAGPGAAFEKGEEVAQRETPLPPSEKELDVLQT